MYPTPGACLRRYLTSSLSLLQGDIKKKACIVVGCLLILAAIIVGIGYATFLRPSTDSNASISNTDGALMLFP